MKVKSKISIIALIAYSITAYGSTTHAPIETSDNSDITFKLNFTTLFLKPSGNQAFAIQAYALPLLSPSWTTYNVTPSYDVGFNLGFTTNFHKKDTSLVSQWEHFTTSNSSPNKSYQGVEYASNMIATFNNIGPEAVNFKQATGVTSYKRDSLRVDYGQNVYVGQDLHANFFSGVNFTRIAHKNSATFNDDSKTNIHHSEINYSISATGPEVGVDVFYKIHQGLNLTSHIATACLTGISNNSTDFTTFYPTLSPNPNQQSVTPAPEIQIIPVISQALGINYEYSFKDHCKARFEIGYQTQIYINALNLTLLNSQVTNAEDANAVLGVYARTFKKEVSNFNLGGPYFKLDVTF